MPPADYDGYRHVFPMRVVGDEEDQTQLLEGAPINENDSTKYFVKPGAPSTGPLDDPGGDNSVRYQGILTHDGAPSTKAL